MSQNAAAHEYDVVVAGAGPTGLVLAIDLGRRGVRTLLVEKDPTTKEWPKMDRSNARTMEIFRRLGLADEVRGLGYPAEASMDVLVVSSLAEQPLTVLEYATVAEHRTAIAASRDGSEPLEPYQLVSQNDLEPLLRSVAETTPGVDVRFGCEVLDFSQDEDGVTVSLGGAGGGAVRAGYLVGCDGGVSTVRKKLGIPLSGRGGIGELVQVTFNSEELYERIPIGKGRHYYFADERGAGFVVQGSRRQFSLNLRTKPDEPDLDLETEIRSRVGFDVDLRVVNSRRWKMHLLLADRYRDGRVFIAGDAAHLVIPTGGLGMNTGVGDANDLAWKLAGTIHGWGGPELLDSYEIERRAVGVRNVEASGWAAEGMFLWQSEWRPEISEDTPEGAEVRRKLAAAAQEHHRRVYEMVGVELGYSYAGSPLVVTEDDDPRAWDTITYTPTGRPGTRLPHVWLSDGRAVQDALGADYALLDLTGEADTAVVEAAFARLGAPLDVLRSDEPDARKVYGASFVLVRPDLHIVWRGDDLGGVADLAPRATGRDRQAVSAGSIDALAGGR
ncbi:FAD-dependent monooxygenase [Nocardioides zeae]|uniref:2-polyprenyl-6-methoxyphenol hydroxylase n=1 Tax=Nocardioides zeae TaxID=1457234 RepID=A0A6P0HLW9_9ACTN|nr:FAD-dependent monooxygenase [Nocardioides zeae]NEN79709.1 2-polyprenyl-6-methoxyphenol hydroxylase [Nocardioides zeae]